MTSQDVHTDFVTRLTGLTMNPEPIIRNTSTRSQESNSPVINTKSVNVQSAPTNSVPKLLTTTIGSSSEPGSESQTDGSSAAGTKANHQPDVTLRALVTTREAGAIIGKEGKNVAAVREATGVRAGVSKVVPGLSERILTVGGPLDAVAKAFSLMAKNLIENPITPVEAPNPTETALIRLLVSHQVMGSIIGKGGTRIKEIQAESGARIGVRKEMLPQSTERIVDISGLVDSIQIAVFYIGECIFNDAERAVGTILYNPAAPPNYYRGGYHGKGRGQGRPKYNNDGYDDGSGQKPQNHFNNYYNNSYRPYNNYRRQSENNDAHNNDSNAVLSQNPSRGGYYNSSRGGLSVGGMVSSRGRSLHDLQSKASNRQSPLALSEEGIEIVSKTTSIPAAMVGCIIGRGGSVINQMRIQSHAKISISKTSNPVTNEREITLEGTQAALDQALTLLYKQLENEKARRLVHTNGLSGNNGNSSIITSNRESSSTSEVVAAVY